MTQFFLVDAFEHGPFTGNPAGVCLLNEPADEAWMAAFAAEVNQAETAFVTPGAIWGLRWFTPVTEVPLCGHATLAAAHVLFESGRAAGSDLAFSTKSGVLSAGRSGSGISIVLPAAKMSPLDPTELRGVLPGVTILDSHRSEDRGLGDIDWMAVLESEDAVRAAAPDLERLTALRVALIVTAPGRKFDCVSRYFAPAWGIDEDFVTGAAHCSVVPYWSSRLGRRDLSCFQASSRGGVLGATVDGDRVTLTGRANTVLRGEVFRR